MRRLAAQSRKDAYKSFRDYQQLLSRVSARLAFRHPRADSLLTVIFDVPEQFIDGDVVVCGAYLSAAGPSVVAIKVLQGETLLASCGALALDDNWRRFGLVGTSISAEPVRVHLVFNGSVALDLWGLSCGKPRRPVESGDPLTAESLDLQHLSPETFYLEHDVALGLDIDEGTEDVSITDGRPILVKKCSYCGRQLPVDAKRPGVLAFHKHNAKISGHQNECRACKKWRINDQFNPVRTADQLHESSVITRERKLLLRDPERLQAIKERTGRGLRSQVWDRFGRKCFKCGTNVALDEFQLDHTRPLAYLWPIDEYATCLCAGCNNEKKEKFPVDFYTAEELNTLSGITGLSRQDLEQKNINEAELVRILTNLRDFAKRWDARTFFAINRKVIELCPEINLALRLKEIDAKQFQVLWDEYSMRELGTDNLEE